MNIVLWVLQVLAGLAFIGAGYMHGLRHEQMKAQQGGQWVGDIPHPLRIFISICEVLGGIALILPAATGIFPWLTPLAGALLALVMLLAVGFHIVRREYPNLVLNLVLLVLAAVVAYGRFVLVPFS
jgi:uncharacterized membrane protein YphA (DoxX/SURF4 family)